MFAENGMVGTCRGQHFFLFHAAAMCQELRPPANGLIQTTGTQFGSTATYSCLPGFNLVGNERRTCQANGFWNGVEPFCQGKKSVVCNTS